MDINIPTSASLFQYFSKYGWSEVFYANPFEIGHIPKQDWKKRWHVGVLTGPDLDLICLKHCVTNKEAHQFLSPGGDDIIQATIKAIKKLKELQSAEFVKPVMII